MVAKTFTDGSTIGDVNDAREDRQSIHATDNARQLIHADNAETEYISNSCPMNIRYFLPLVVLRRTGAGELWVSLLVSGAG
jgi:hypothetical protein